MVSQVGASHHLLRAVLRLRALVWLLSQAKLKHRILGLSPPRFPTQFWVNLRICILNTFLTVAYAGDTL